MSYKFKVDKDICILNFSEECPTTPAKLVDSGAFKCILQDYLTNLRTQKGIVYNYLSQCCDDSYDKLVKDLLKLVKQLLVMDSEEICKTDSTSAKYLSKSYIFLKFIEGLYLYWRRLQRYGIVVNSHNLNSLEDGAFLEAQSKFRDLVLHTYRRCEKAIGFRTSVYRQIIAGFNVGINLNLNPVTLPDCYSQLKSIPVIDRITINPPFITNSKRYKRSGLFEEVKKNPIRRKDFNPDEWFCYPAKVGKLIIFVYFNVGFLSQGVSLMNLFEMAHRSEYEGKNPDLIYVCGYDDGQKNQIFYQDNKNDIVLGYLSLNDDFDYFGYMKKMILTLHNIKQINQGCLPIHGAMVEIKFLNGTTKNVIIMGDSGAGKSETIEQIKNQGRDVIDEMKVVYDDMGVLIQRDSTGQILTSGTEIGAFVRLNDLDSGYGYKELDRSVIMNPDKLNARIVVPTASWNDVTWKYHIDYFMYANNYEDNKDLVTFFNNTEDALEVFKRGRRMAKGTTSELGISESYFANPFGPVQRKDQTEVLLKKFFDAMFEQGIKVGQIYTRLGLEGMAQDGPKSAASHFLSLLT